MTVDNYIKQCVQLPKQDVKSHTILSLQFSSKFSSSPFGIRTHEAKADRITGRKLNNYI